MIIKINNYLKTKSNIEEIYDGKKSTNRGYDFRNIHFFLNWKNFTIFFLNAVGLYDERTVILLFIRVTNL